MNKFRVYTDSLVDISIMQKIQTDMLCNFNHYARSSSKNRV